MRILLNFRQLLLAWVGQSVWQSIWQLSLDFNSSSGCYTDKHGHTQQSDGSPVETHVDLVEK